MRSGYNSHVAWNRSRIAQSRSFVAIGLPSVAAERPNLHIRHFGGDPTVSKTKSVSGPDGSRRRDRGACYEYSAVRSIVCRSSGLLSEWYIEICDEVKGEDSSLHGRLLLREKKEDQEHALGINCRHCYCTLLMHGDGSLKEAPKFYPELKNLSELMKYTLSESYVLEFGQIPRMDMQKAKRTTLGIPTWSPTVVLIQRLRAYIWQSGRDA